MSVISLIAAMARNGVIGHENRLPWHLPADLQHFKSLTLGKPILMGRNTWESLPGVLPGRRHIVVTRNPDYQAPGGEVVHSVDEALAAVSGEPEIMIVGGSHFYSEMMPRADRIYLTKVDADVEGDVYFPEIDWSEWREETREEHAADEKNIYSYSFVKLVRI
ncbi:MAG: type 3 dihydrofolate reductase [Candidatus Thiodiazotropha sp. LLP2]